MPAKAIQEFIEARSKLIILFGVLIGIFVFGTLAYWIALDITLAGAFIYTLDTFAFMLDHQEGAARIIQVVLLVFGVVFIWFAVWTALDVLLEGHFRRYLSEVHRMGSIKKLRNHYIICGGGRVGTHVAELLVKQKRPFVLVEQKEEHIQSAHKNGYPVIDGDAIDEKSLREAGIERARVLISVLPETEKNVLVVLTAKELNPKLEIFARSNRQEYIRKLKKAGADHVVTPEFACAEEIVMMLGKK